MFDDGGLRGRTDNEQFHLKVPVENCHIAGHSLGN
jgi:hypothetical protein